jgi:hypothetical protein
MMSASLLRRYARVPSYFSLCRSEKSSASCPIDATLITARRGKPRASKRSVSTNGAR